MPDPKDRIFISIAVSKPDGGLQALPGAIKASERMAAWADAHGYIPLLINDKLFPEVTTELLRCKISEAIEGVTNRAVLDRIVIFFAGHGAAIGIDDQTWMLSNWDKRWIEAVRLSSLQRVLEYYGPKQVTIIGDACQEYSARFINVIGNAVLDTTDEHPRNFELDRFFPVDAGSQAFMIKGKEDEEDFCLFTEVMLAALEGDAPADYFEEIDGGRHVTSQTLAQYLEDNLAAEAGKFGMRMDPRPRPGFYTDRVYYSAPEPGGPAQSGPLPAEDTAGDESEPIGTRSPKALPRRKSGSRARLTASAGRNFLDVSALVLELTRRKEELEEKRREEEKAYSAAASEDVRDHFKTGCGICITGAGVGNVRASRGTLSQVNLPPNWFRLELSDERDPLLWADVLVELADGSVASACIVQNFITAMHVFETGGTNVLHRMLGAYHKHGKEIIALLGRLNAGSLTEEEIVDSAAAMRWEKHQVITVGAVVAQLYDSIRDTASLRSIAAFYAQKNQPIPLDIVLYGGGRLFARDNVLYANIPATPEREPRSEAEREWRYPCGAMPEVIQHPIAGRVPWMRQAWSGIETADCDESAEEWRDLALSALPHLGAGQFSQVRREGRDALFALSGITDNREDPAPIMAVE